MMTRISCSGSLISGFFCFVFASSADAIQPAAQKSPPHIDYDTVLAQHIAATMAQPEGRVLWRDTRFSHEQFALVSWQIPLAENLATGPLVTFQQDYHPLPLNSAVPQDISRVGWRLDYHLATPALAALARQESIYKGEKFSDHAPITIGYELAL